MMKRYQSWSSRLIWIYQTKTPKKQNCYMLDYACVCPSCIKAMSIHLWSSIKSSMIYVSHFLSPILSLQRLFFVELPAAASPLTWSQYLPVRLGNFFQSYPDMMAREMIGNALNPKTHGSSKTRIPMIEVMQSHAIFLQAVGLNCVEMHSRNAECRGFFSREPTNPLTVSRKFKY